MTMTKKPMKNKQLRTLLSQELNFLKNVFSVMSIPIQMKGDNEENMDYEIVNDKKNDTGEQDFPKRARNIAELEEKLNKIKSQNKFNLKNKLVKKSLNSKLNKKLKKKERLNKKNMKPAGDTTPLTAGETPTENVKVPKVEKKPNVIPKPVFNHDGKLVFSKFDFDNVGTKEKGNKVERDPKKILENLKQQEQKIRQLEENDEGSKVKELKEKVAWKTALQKAEGQKVKDDPTLLKKSIKKMDQKKKHSQKKWNNRIKGVEQKKDDRQKKRKENISKKNKEKKSKVVKASIKRGRVVI